MSPACRGSNGAIPPRLLAVSSAGKPLLEPRVVQFSRLVALSTWGELVRAPLMVQFPPFGGGFAPLGASARF